MFFARITLEDKIGTAYEPYIFAALNSARVMVALGTKPEYFNAVWVKNEWSRYLALIKSGADKTLVPAYRDMDPYDLPEEFAHLQAQDMGKLGFMQDLIRGIKKILHKDEPKTQTVAQPIAATPANNAAPLVKRAFMSLEDGDFAKADDFCEQALNIDPENGRAWLGKLMAQLKVRREEDLKNQPKPLGGNTHFLKVMRFGDESLRKQMRDDIEYINNRNEYERQKGIFDTACTTLRKATTIEQCLEAMMQFRTIEGFSGVKEQTEACNVKIESINAAKYQKAATLQAAGNWQEAIQGFMAIKNYRDSREKIAECEEAIRADAYQSAIESKNRGEWYLAILAFEKLGNYQDSREKIAECEEAIRADAYQSAMEFKNNGKWDDAIRAFNKLGDYRDSRKQADLCKNAQEMEEREKEEHRKQERIAAEARIRAEATKRRNRTILIVAVIAIIVAGAVLYLKVIKPNNMYNSMYNSALSAMNAGNYDEATTLFEELGDYKDAATQAQESQYQKGTTLLADGNYDGATEVFTAISGYNDAATQALESQYQKAQTLYQKGEYNNAYNLYTSISGYKDTDSLLATDDNLIAAAAAAAAWRAQFEVGNTVAYGRYEQDDNTANGAEAIEWVVLANDGETATLISRYGLDAKPYNTEYTSVTWENCTLRKWLNGDFLNAAFSDEERAKLKTVTVTADANPTWSTDPGNDTQDTVFLLSIDEVNRYFDTDEARVCMPTKTAVANGAYTDSSSGTCWWWLRSPGYHSNFAASVDLGGSVFDFGYPVNRDEAAVRPVVVLRPL